MPVNSVWRIAWGDYDFALDRKTLTYDLIETQTGTVWATALPVGWIELEDRSTGERVRHDFATAKLVSVAEKSSAQGKRLLLGLDLLGIPIDLYFICSEREIQLTVEASRDTREYLVGEIGLLPGLVAVPEDKVSYLIFPWNNGQALFAHELQTQPFGFVIWSGSSFPFVGAVKCGVDLNDCRSSLGLMTDSAYGEFVLSKEPNKEAVLNAAFGRDPEHRRIEVRMILKPHANHIAIARAYREKLISERNHVTFKMKMREKPQIESLIGAAGILSVDPERLRPYRLTIDICTKLKIDKAQYPINTLIRYSDSEGTFQPDFALIQSVESAGYKSVINMDILDYDQMVSNTQISPVRIDSLCFSNFFTGLTPEVGYTWGFNNVSTRNRWEQMEWFTERLKNATDLFDCVGMSDNGNEWSIPYIHFVQELEWMQDNWYPGTQLPLWSVCHRDEVAQFLETETSEGFLRALLALALPLFRTVSDMAFMERAYAVLSHMHRLSYSSFMTEHQFLTGKLQVEKVVYSDKTHVIINRSDTEAFERQDLHLPPLGFYVRHAQMEAHYALRVGEQTFNYPAWRIRRARDGKRLEESEDVLYQEFPV